MTWFNAGEQSRLQSITCLKRRRQFIVGHHLARCLAAEIRGGDPAAWQLQRHPSGAPRLQAPAPHMADLAVSLSHSGDWVGCAIASDSIGLDVETGTRAHDLPGLARFIFSEDEHAYWQELPAAEQISAFYTLWTLKEARGKFAGAGLRFREARRETFSRTSAAQQARGITWRTEGVHVALFGAPGLQARISAPLEHASQELWQLAAAENPEGSAHQ